MDVHQADALLGPRCSELAAELGEPLAGTASLAATWLCVEQPGPWGRDALQESHFDTGVGRELATRSAGTGVRVTLIRRPGSHPDRHRPVPRRVYLAHTAPGRTWLERWSVGDPKELLDLDFAAAGAGVAPGLGEPVSGPLLLICTNGRRDVCCALMGRPIAATLAGVHGENVWECTHLGGHRFAPTGLALPSGYSYGRLSLASAGRLLAPGSGVLVDLCRGRSTWDAPGQVAELAVRLGIDDRDPDSLSVSEDAPEDGRWQPVVSHRDGRRWRVSVRERTSPDLRSASCGAVPKPLVFLDAEELIAV
jgi:hypothetical protein